MKRRRSITGRNPPPHAFEPIHRIEHLPLLFFCTLLACLFLLLASKTPAHTLTIDLPHPFPEDYIGPLTPNADRLTVTDTGVILWNGELVSERQLGAILDSPHRKQYWPTLLFTPDGDASYARVLQVMNIVRVHGAVDRCFRLSGIARFQHYDRPRTFDEQPPPEWADCLAME